tara:strand:+ start:250 stop:450 length:201 start_codon:yes stop_codon:yes gene_type:complete
MKEGDLVQLSSYGNKLKCLKDFKGCIGMISIYIPTSKRMKYRVDWFINGKVKRERHTRKDLKKVKK